MQESSTNAKLECFVKLLHYVQEVSASFYDYSRFNNIEELLDFTSVLEAGLDEAEFVGIGIHNALIAPMVGMKMPLLEVDKVPGNHLIVPLSYIVGDIARNIGDVKVNDESTKVNLIFGSHIFDVKYCDLGRNYQSQLMIHGQASDVLVPIAFTYKDEREIDLDSLSIESAFEYYPHLTSSRLDLGEFLPRYFNGWLMSNMSFGDRDSIACRDRFIARVISKYFAVVEVPATMVMDAFKLMRLTGDDIRHSRSYRTALFVSELFTNIAKTQKCTVVLK